MPKDQHLRFSDTQNEYIQRAGFSTCIFHKPYKEFLEVVCHESETALDDYDGFDALIKNDGTVEDLFATVWDICEEFELLY